MGIKLLRCSCSHEYQDQQYGKGIRVFNTGTPKSIVKKHTCTVCEKTINR